MNALSLFPRQIIQARLGNRGQAVPLFLVVSVALLSLVFSTVYLSHLSAGAVASSDAIDSIALSAATVEARALNLISALNEGVFECLRIIRLIAVIWAALAVVAATGYGVPIYTAYSNYARRMIRNLWSRARDFAEWAEKVRKAAPGLVLAETMTLSGSLNVTGILSPCNPGGSHDSRGTLELHLKKGTPIGLTDSLGPILDVPGKLGSSGTGRAVKAILDVVLGSLIAGAPEPIRMLEPEDDFQKRQQVRFDGVFVEPELELPFLRRFGKHRISASASAEPYGGDKLRMTWKSRLIECGTAP